MHSEFSCPPFYGCRERASSHQIVAHVQDAAMPEWECVSRVEVAVMDVNDNEPKFPRDQKTIYFDENEPGRTRVTRVNAKDADSGENQQISYSIANPDADEIPFVIDHSNGVIKSTRLVDFESDRREYKLQVGIDFQNSKI